jgi:hypothetical protein
MVWWFHWWLISLALLAMVQAIRIIVYNLMIKGWNDSNQFLYLVVSVLLLSLGAYLTDHLEISRKGHRLTMHE